MFLSLNKSLNFILLILNMNDEKTYYHFNIPPFGCS